MRMTLTVNGQVKEAHVEFISRRTWWKPWTWLCKPRQIRVIDDVQLTHIALVPADQVVNPRCIIKAGTVLEAKPGHVPEPNANRNVYSPEVLRKMAEECDDPVKRKWCIEQLEKESD